MKTKAQNWGNSLAVRVPRGLSEQAGLKAGDVVEIAVVKGSIVLTPAAPQAARYELKDLVKGITRANLYKAEEFGKPEGREAW
jgi:antitoxin MazE